MVHWTAVHARLQHTVILHYGTSLSGYKLYCMYSAEGGSASKAVQQLVGEVLNWGAHASKE
jgi:hypothetical protein